MSIVACRCGKIVDTDIDDRAYTVETSDMEEIELRYPLCQLCRARFAEMLDFKEKVEAMASRAPEIGLGGFLPGMYDLIDYIEKMTNPEKPQ